MALAALLALTISMPADHVVLDRFEIHEVDGLRATAAAGEYDLASAGAGSRAGRVGIDAGRAAGKL